MSDDRRPLGQPEFSEPATDLPTAGDRRPAPPMDRPLFLPPADGEPVAPAMARRPLSGGGPNFSSKA
ncbi:MULTISPECIES: hypothetical protein [Kitasatospora]|uniref:Uncharacterized protein n=2 Tax=Kitasatospora TaxID=2063 RepID=A0ABT1J306_9ACTN|nr:hypothetical protein [Kitasatospora paracochleata]MCP2311748.1 hypothetical protein [Kitasatospora paracochleata]